MKGVGEKKGEREREAEKFTHWLPHVTKTSYPQATIPKQSVEVTLAHFCFVFLNAKSPEHPPPVPSHLNIKI